MLLSILAGVPQQWCFHRVVVQDGFATGRLYNLCLVFTIQHSKDILPHGVEIEGLLAPDVEGKPSDLALYLVLLSLVSVILRATRMELDDVVPVLVHLSSRLLRHAILLQ